MTLRPIAKDQSLKRLKEILILAAIAHEMDAKKNIARVIAEAKDVQLLAIALIV